MIQHLSHVSWNRHWLTISSIVGIRHRQELSWNVLKVNRYSSWIRVCRGLIWFRLKPLHCPQNKDLSASEKVSSFWLLPDELYNFWWWLSIMPFRKKSTVFPEIYLPSPNLTLSPTYSLWLCDERWWLRSGPNNLPCEWIGFRKSGVLPATIQGRL